MRIFLRFNQWNYLTVNARIANDNIEGRRKNISFVIDTGAPMSSIGFMDAVKLNIQYDQLKKEDDEYYIGGAVYDRYILDNSIITILDDNNLPKDFKLPLIYVLSPDPPDQKPLPSILGNNFISQFTLVINAAKFGRRAFFIDRRI